MNRQEFLRCVAEELNHALENGIATRLLVLLPQKLRDTAVSRKTCDFDIEFLDEGLRRCEALVLKCPCSICDKTVPSDTLRMPECLVKRKLLMNVLARTALDFDPTRYSHGDITRLVVARHSDACRSRLERRSFARSVIKRAKRDMHVVASRVSASLSSGKRTQRIEALRDAMGAGAFSEMVSRQLWARRTRGSAPSGCGQDWVQTLQWWHSDEGMMYWKPPPQPHPRHVSDILQRRGLGRGLRGCFPVPSVEKTLEVPKSVVPQLALKITDWLQERQEDHFPGLKSRCSMSGCVNFNREDGERVPSVHISCKQHMGDDLVLLDAASLENLMPGDVVEPRALLDVHGRVVATVAWEEVALALPRPHDKFDVHLRGNMPQTSRLADLTNTLEEAELHVVWVCPLWGRSCELVVKLKGMDDVNATDETLQELWQSLSNDLDSHYAPMYQHFLVRRRLYIDLEPGPSLRLCAHWEDGLNKQSTGSATNGSYPAATGHGVDFLPATWRDLAPTEHCAHPLESISHHFSSFSIRVGEQAQCVRALRTLGGWIEQAAAAWRRLGGAMAGRLRHRVSLIIEPFQRRFHGMQCQIPLQHRQGRRCGHALHGALQMTWRALKRSVDCVSTSCKQVAERLCPKREPRQPRLARGLPPGMGFSGAGKGGKGKVSESMSLLEEMKLKQEKREQRKRLREEVDSLMVSSPQDIGRIARLRQELSYVEGFLAQADGNLSLPTHQPQTSGPLTAAEGQDTNNLYVGSLSTEWTEELLSREFGRFGEITSIKIMYPRTDQQRLRGMNSGFVQFKTRAQAELARTKLNGKEYFGMCLRIDWGRAIQPVRNVSAVMGLGVTPSIISKPALMPHVETPKPKPMPMITSGESSSASNTGERKSRWNLAKTLVVKVPEDQVLKKLIDKTAEFVADEGWEFEKLLLDKEKGNPRFGFMSVDKDNLEEPLHVYYRWRTFSFSQGDNDRFWRTEPFQIYENGPLWQPPPCDKRVEEVPDAIQRIDMLMPSAGVQAGDLLGRKSGTSVSTSGKDNVIGGVGLAPEEVSAFQELIGDLTLSRSSILKAMVFCVDKSMSSLQIAQKIGASITEAQSGLTTQQLVARMYLLNDVLYNSHCTKPGASQYRRQFQDLLPDVMERLREVCDGISSIAACALRDRVLKLVETWTEWALFPPRFTKGLEAVMCHTVAGEGQQGQQWQSTTDLATLERACRQRGLSIKGSRPQLVQRLCLFEAYWPPEELQSAPKLPKDLGIDGKIEAGLDGEPSLGLSVLLLPERWQDGTKPSKLKVRKTVAAPAPSAEPSSKKAKKETKETKETKESAQKEPMKEP
eukprot:s901_g16.t1